MSHKLSSLVIHSQNYQEYNFSLFLPPFLSLLSRISVRDLITNSTFLFFSFILLLSSLSSHFLLFSLLAQQIQHFFIFFFPLSILLLFSSALLTAGAANPAGFLLLPFLLFLFNLHAHTQCHITSNRPSPASCLRP